MSQHNPSHDAALALPLTGVQLIEASAGTGKTFTLAGLFVRLIVEQRREPAQILVMTFTRAATDELRGRLRQRLAACCDVAAGGSVDPDDADQVWAQRYLATLDAAALAGPVPLPERLRGALRSMDEAAIHTIHGFCQRVLSEFAALLDVVADAELVPSDRDLVTDYAADFWLRVGGEAHPPIDALHVLGADPAALAGNLLDALAGEARCEVSQVAAVGPDLAAAQAAVEAADAAVQAAWQADPTAVDRFTAVFEAGGLDGRSFPRKTTPPRLALLRAQLTAGAPVATDVAKALGGAKVHEKRNNKAADFVVPPLFDALDDLFAARQQLATAQTGAASQLASRALDGVGPELARRKRALARQSYDDLINRVDAGLDGAQGDVLVKALRRRFPVALLDEFQDTDQRQYSIFQRIYADQAQLGLFLVGDPKQAIYAFRGGDLEAYLRVAGSIDPAHTHALDTNYRSSPALLDAAATVFGQTTAPFIDARIGFQAVQPGGRVADAALRVDGAPLPAMTLWPLPAGLNAEAQRDYYAHGCAATIAQLLRTARLADRPLTPGDIAVLTNTNREITRVQAALSQLGIASACVRHESIFATREAGELLRLLDALLVPQSMALARGALATRLLGGTLSHLQQLAGDERAWREALDRFADLHQRWFTRGVLALVDRVAETEAPRLLARGDGERIVGNLLQLGETLQADARTLDGPRALRDRLAAAIALADGHNEEEQLGLESDAERVQVATIHTSKGLEYKLVMLPFVNSMKARDVKAGQILDFHDDAGARVKYWLLAGKDDRTPADADACARAAREAHGEVLRKFYVAVTRAAHACWLAFDAKSALWQGLLDGKPVQALTAACPAIVEADAMPPAQAWQPPAPQALQPAKAFEASIRRDWQRLSFSRLTRGGHDLGGGKRDEPAAPADVASGAVLAAPAGPRFGTAVHAILEQADFAAWRDADTVPPTQRDLLQRELRAHGYALTRRGDDVVAATGRLIAATLNAECVPGLRFADLAPTARRAEMEFDFGINGCATPRIMALLHAAGYQRHRDGFASGGTQWRGLMNGIIDLIFVHDGRWYLVDWKTNFLGDQYRDYQPDRLQVAVTESDYDLQYLIYTVALQRWLRTTLGAAWDYERDFGGVRYLFLRGLAGGAGCGVHADNPSLALINELDAALAAPERT